MTITAQTIQHWLEGIDDYGMGDGRYWIPTKEGFEELCKLALSARPEAVPMSLLEEIQEYLEDASDVRDGLYGEPTPNRAMILAGDLERYLPTAASGTRPETQSQETK
jgi:hypothetical protein